MNAIVMSQRIEPHTRRISLLGHYDASDLQRAMRFALGRAHLRSLRKGSASRSPINCDVRPDGRRVEL